jgi:hypothetical protein
MTLIGEGPPGPAATWPFSCVLEVASSARSGALGCTYFLDNWRMFWQVSDRKGETGVAMPAIKIKQLQDGTVGFVPHRPGSKPGDPLTVDRGVGVIWNNETPDAHWPWPLDGQGKPMTEADARALGFYLTDEIHADRPSDPIYGSDPQFSTPPANVGGPTLKYQCRHHPNEIGFIFIREN